jgi:glyoxylase-like metal-dependent hydrolase (beta-lactamase superfamily II)
MAKANSQFQATVLFYQPGNRSGEWSRTELTKEARAIPGVRVLFDLEGKLTRRFGAETSGHTVVYDCDGKLLFSGGITGSRGHLGDNAGFDAVLKLVRKESGPGEPRTTSVFGCGIFDQCTRN